VGVFSLLDIFCIICTLIKQAADMILYAHVSHVYLYLVAFIFTRLSCVVPILLSIVLIFDLSQNEFNFFLEIMLQDMYLSMHWKPAASFLLYL